MKYGTLCKSAPAGLSRHWRMHAQLRGMLMPAGCYDKKKLYLSKQLFYFIRKKYQILEHISPASSTHLFLPSENEKHCRPASHSSVVEHSEHFEPGSFSQLEITTIAENPKARKNSVGNATFNIFFI
jgi:hypothetical protein